MIPPRQTDACIAIGVDSHVVFRPDRTPAEARLFVFLAGTGGAPRHYQQILLAASRAGYHAIGLVYPNNMSVSVLCAAEPMPCYGATREEVLTGESRSGVVSVNRANSIEHRLFAAVRWLHAHDAGGQWHRFLSSDSALAWGRVSVAGHSQGGGYALFMAQRYILLRATAYASYGDYLPATGAAADWITQPYATPVARLSGFISSREDAISFPLALATWSRIGMVGAPVLVDTLRTGSVPVGSQWFVTAALPASLFRTATPFHDMVVLDAQTPVTASGIPVFSDIWRVMSFPEW